MNFKTNVFINCPFDEAYYDLLRPLLFTISYLGFTPRIALERLDSGESRILKIVELIQSSMFGVHDLSRLKASKEGEFFRLNMPFELGIDYGCREFGVATCKSKKMLIMVAEPYAYQAAISDLAGSDVKAHGNNAEKVVEIIRNWLSVVGQVSDAVGPSRIWGYFTDFMANNYDRLTERGFSKKDIENLPIATLLADIENWVRRQ